MILFDAFATKSSHIFPFLKIDLKNKEESTKKKF